MRVGRLEFRAALLPTLAAIVTVAVTASLGRWQMHRAQEKIALEQTLIERQSRPPLLLTGHEPESDGLQFRQLRALGTFDASKEILLDNKVEDGEVGYHVLTPLAITGTRRYVLVNRGWVGRSRLYPAPPDIGVPTGEVSVEGYGSLPVKRFLELSAEVVQGKVWENMTFERYRSAMHLDILPIIVAQSNDTGDGLRRVRDRPDAGISMHQGYAFQWFVLCAAVVLTYLAVNTKYVDP
jgi:surfeit locus 1 family protein